MYGIEAVNAHNGWAISAVGIIIVFSGLVSLSLVISQLHKVLAMWEDPEKFKALFRGKPKAEKSADTLEEENFVPVVLTKSQKETAKQMALLVRTMEDHFSLSRLLHLSKISGLNEPYANLNCLFLARIICPDGSGYFTWDKEVFDKSIS
jgi:hypothetical protein